MSRIGRGLALGGVAALAIVGVVKLVPIGVAWWIPALAAITVGTIFGVLRVGVGRWSDLRGAHALDRALGLRDRLGTAMALDAGLTADDAVLELIAQESERVAADARPDRAVAVRFGRSWAIAAVALGVAAGVGFFVPVRGAGRAEATAAQREQERQEVSREVNSAIEAIEESLAQELDESGVSQEELASLEELRAELEAGAIEPEDAAAESAAALERAADELDRAGERDTMADQRLRDQLADAAPGDSEWDEAPEPLDALREAFESGDLERARDAARELMESADRLSPEDRERLARELEELADAIEPDPAGTGGEQQPFGEDPRTQRSATEPGERGPSDAGAEREQGVEDRADQLEREGMDPATAREQAEREQRQREQRQAEQDAREDRQRLADGARESAEQIRRERQPSENPGTGEQEQRPSGEPTPSGQRDPSSTDGNEPQQGPESGEGEQPRREGGQDPNDQTQPGATPRQGDESNPGESQQGAEERNGEQPGAGTPEPGGEQGDQGERQPGQSGEQSDAQQPGETPQSEENGTGDGQREGARQEPGENGAPSQRPAGEGAGRTPQGGDQRGTPDGQRPPGESRERLDEALDDLSERRERGQQRRDGARRLRERADETLGRDPGEGAGDERDRSGGSDQMPRSGGGDREPDDPLGASGGAGSQDPAGPEQEPGTAPSATEPADFRRGDNNDADGGIVSDWYDPDKPMPEGVGRADAARRMRDAADSARRAVEQQRVPRKYRDLIRRVYERMESRSSGLEDVPLGETVDTPPDGG